MTRFSLYKNTVAEGCGTEPRMGWFFDFDKRMASYGMIKPIVKWEEHLAPCVDYCERIQVKVCYGYNVDDARHFHFHELPDEAATLKNEAQAALEERNRLERERKAKIEHDRQARLEAVAAAQAAKVARREAQKQARQRFFRGVGKLVGLRL